MTTFARALSGAGLAEAQFPPRWPCRFWISDDGDGWTAWMTPDTDRPPSRAGTFRTRGEAEAYCDGIVFGVTVIYDHFKGTRA